MNTPRPFFPPVGRVMRPMLLTSCPPSLSLSLPFPSLVACSRLSPSLLRFPHFSSSPSLESFLLLPSRFHPSPPADPPRRHANFICKSSEYKFPDPIPAFAESETDKFRKHMFDRLTKKMEYFGGFTEEIVELCTEIFSKFLHTEYGGPGTLLVDPFIDMADTINEKGLPGAPQAARAAIAWAEKHVDKDWKEWTGDSDTD